MDAADPLHIRPARAEDLPAVQYLMAAYDMVGDFTMEDCLVAERDGVLAGFARIEYLWGQAYLRPIVVPRDSQGQGVGKVLLQRILARGEALTVVARGSAAGFYTRLGFKPLDWFDVPRRYRNECDVCPDCLTCQPQPLVYRPDEVNSANYPAD